MDCVTILRGRRLMAGGAVLGLVAGLALSTRSQPLYQARAMVLVRPVLADPFSDHGSNSSLDVFTERQRALSGVVAEKAKRRMGTPEDLRTIGAHLTVAVTGGSQLLDFSYRHPSVEGARRGAQAFAEAYLEAQRETATVVTDKRRTELEADLAPLDAAIAEALTAVGRAAPRSAQWAAARAQLRYRTGQARPYWADLAAVSAIDVTGGGTIVSSAQRPTHRTGQSRAFLAGAGLVIGLLAGFAASYGRWGTDQRLWGQADVETHLTCSRCSGGMPAQEARRFSRQRAGRPRRADPRG